MDDAIRSLDPLGDETSGVTAVGRFRCLRVLGRGGSATVWQVEDPLRPGQALALKLFRRALRRSGRPSRESVAPWERELLVGLSVRHPALVEPLECGAVLDPIGAGRRAYLLSEFVPGDPARSPLSEDAALAVLRDILAALDAIHAAGWAHGDIHPQNVLVCADPDGWRARLLDFGLARVVSRDPEPLRLGGVARYLAPEILRGEAPDMRSDLYALGVVIYEAVQGSPRAKLAEHLLRTHSGELYEEVRATQLPEPLGRLLRGLLDPEPSSRVQTPADALGLLLQGRPDEVPLRVSPSFEAPFVIGADEVVRDLELRLARSGRRGGGVAVVCVEGDRGLGKSRIVREAMRLALSRGVRCLSWPQARAMASERSAKPERDVRNEPADWHGSLLSISGGSDPIGVDRVAESILEGLTEAPTLLAVDDLSGLSSIDQELARSVVEKAWLSQSRRRAGVRPRFLLVVATVSSQGERETPTRTLWRRWTTAPYGSSHVLQPWDSSEVSEYFDAVLRPSRSLGDDVDEILRSAGGGIPATLRRVLTVLHARGTLRLKDRCWECQRDVVEGVELPGDKDRFLEEWSGLSTVAREALVCAALHGEAGVATTPAALRQALGLRSTDLDRVLWDLRARGLFDGLVGQTGLGGEDLPVPNRRSRAWILRLSGWSARRRNRLIVSRTGSTELARLYQRLRLGPVSADEVRRTSPSAETLERVLEAHARSRFAPPVDRAESARALGESLLRKGDGPGAGKWLRRALVTGTTGRIQGWLHLLLGESAMVSRDLGTAETHLRHAGARIAADDPARPRWLFGMAVLRLRSGDVTAATELALEGSRRFAEVPAFLNLLGTASLERQDVSGAIDAFERATQIAQSRGIPHETAAARINLARVLIRTGRLDEAIRHLEESARTFEELGIKSEQAVALGNLGVTLRRLGRFPEAVQALDRAWVLYRELGDLAGLSVIHGSLAIVAREVGLLGTAERHVHRAQDAAAEAGSSAVRRLNTTPVLLESRALLCLEFGDIDDAIALCDRARRLAEANGMPHSPEAVLLELRLLLDQGREAGRLWESVETLRPLGVADAPWLSELARSPDPARAWARDRLLRLTEVSEGARLYVWMASAQRGEASPAEEAWDPGALLDLALKEPRRQERLRALLEILALEAPEAIRVQARTELSRTLDEVLIDLPPQRRGAVCRREPFCDAIERTRRSESGERSMGTTPAVLSEVCRFTREILMEGNVDRLLRKLVDAAMSLTRAERGFLALRERGALVVQVARSAGQDLDSPEGQVSHTILQSAISDGVARITSDAREDDALRSVASVEDLGLRSVICVPLVGKRSRPLGALYLDNPLQKGVFGPQHLEIVESFCAQGVLAWRVAERRREREALVRELARAKKRVEAELASARRDVSRRDERESREFAGMVGASSKMRKIFDWIRVVAPTDIPVLITGESGCGKELVARAIHRHSRRAERPFVAENCAAVPAGLLESVLFGHTKGAFTGADRNRSGLFELADGGTLFLDEIGLLPLDLQARLLRVLQEGEVRPLGSDRTTRVDVRVVAATNEDVRRAMAEGRFREDIYYRLQGTEIDVPPLRERPEDIPHLAAHFLRKSGASTAVTVTAEAMERLVTYRWPGNVRELENEMRRAALMAGGGSIGVDSLSPVIRSIQEAVPGARQAPDERPVRSLVEAERDAILEAMRRFDGHRGKAAEALGIARSTLYLKLKQFGLDDAS